MTYFWLQFSGLDPHEFRGLTQRIAVVIMFGWYAVAGSALLSSGTAPSKMELGGLAARLNSGVRRLKQTVKPNTHKRSKETP